MEIRYAVPPSDAKTQSITYINLDFLKSFEGHNTASFTLTPIGDDTSVEWAMHCKSDLTSKVMQCIFDVDKFVGKDFETGLANLKGVVEKPR